MLTLTPKVILPQKKHFINFKILTSNMYFYVKHLIVIMGENNQLFYYVKIIESSQKKSFIHLYFLLILRYN